MIHNEKQIIDNLRKLLEKLNNYTFSDGEWDRFFSGFIASKNDGILEKTRKIQGDYIGVLTCDDGTQKIYICLTKRKYITIQCRLSINTRKQMELITLDRFIDFRITHIVQIRQLF